jgi:Tfp pilus assembly protein PilX
LEDGSLDHQISDKGRPIRRFRTHQEKGAISIAFALGIILLLFVIAVTSLSYIGTDTRSASNFLTKSKAFYAAEAGLELALGDLKNNGTGEFANVTIGDATVTTTVTDDTLLDVTATADGISKSLRVVVNT